MKLSIKHKLMFFIVFLLIGNLLIVSFLTMQGIRSNQKKEYEKYLMESSKIANLYIREKYLTSGSKNYETFYKQKAFELTIDLERILGIQAVIFDKQGRQIGNEAFQNSDYTALISQALRNQIVYKKEREKIIYIAPVYDFEKQIGLIKLEYSLSDQNYFYEETSRLFIKFGLVSLGLMLIIGRKFFKKIIKNLQMLQISIASIEKGNYDIAINRVKSQDEFEVLSLGIENMSKQIQTNIRDLENEKNKLQIALEQVRMLEKKQKEFIGNITHEFKTPLTVIKTQLDLMQLYNDDKELYDRCNQVSNSEIKRLNNMVENILYLSSLEQYEFELKKEIIRTDVLLKEIADKLNGKAIKYDIEIYLELEECSVSMDRESFTMIFINLIDNAIKYNVSKGKIFIRSYKVNGNINRIEIADTGIGISQTDREHIFEPFYTVDKNKSKQLSGTGLGLSLVKTMLSKQNSDIKVLGLAQGTCFQIDIPLSTRIDSN